MADDLLCLLRNYNVKTFSYVYAASPSKAGIVFEWYVCWKNGLIHWNRIRPDQFQKLNIPQVMFKRYKHCKKCGELCTCCDVCSGYCVCYKGLFDYGIDSIDKNMSG